MSIPPQVELLKRGAATWNEWRTKHPVALVDLSGSDLGPVDLSSADLSDANLSDCNLDRARLINANLAFTKLKGACLGDTKLLGASIDGADFSDADLSRADLRDVAGSSRQGGRHFYTLTFRSAQLQNALFNGAVFRGAIFDGADLTKANLRRSLFYQCSFANAVFDGAILGDTLFVAVDLSAAKGLENIDHRVPSSLDQATIRNGRGKLPSHFLRSCGLSDFEIIVASLYDTTLPPERVTAIAYDICDARLTNPLQFYPIFISYSHADTQFIDILGKHLTGAGIHYWRDVHDMTVGRLATQIDQAIRINPVVLLVLSKNSLDSDWVEWEATRARELERTTGRDVLCPVALDDSWKPARWSPSLLQQISKYHILDMSGWSDPTIFRQQFKKVIRGLGLFYSKAAASDRP